MLLPPSSPGWSEIGGGQSARPAATTPHSLSVQSTASQEAAGGGGGVAPPLRASLRKASTQVAAAAGLCCDVTSFADVIVICMLGGFVPSRYITGDSTSIHISAVVHLYGSQPAPGI
jgi:hypothetical protein